MNLRFFFNRRSQMVQAATLLGWVLCLWHLKTGLLGGLFPTFIFLAFLVTAVRYFPWNPSAHRGLGVEEHFEKTMVPLAYLMVLIGLLGFWIVPWPLIILGVIFSALVSMVNFILIALYLRDKDPDPPAFLSRDLHR